MLMASVGACVSRPLLAESSAKDPLAALDEVSRELSVSTAALETPTWDGPAQDEDELLVREAELTRRVPELLDAMNRAASEVNMLDKQLAAAQERCRRLAEKCERLYPHEGPPQLALGIAAGGALLRRLKLGTSTFLGAGHAAASASPPAGAGGPGSAEGAEPGAVDSAIGEAAGLIASESARRPMPEGVWRSDPERDEVGRSSLAQARSVAQEFQASEARHAEARARLRSLEARLEESGALSQEMLDDLSFATAEVVRCQKDRDRLEQDHVRALADFAGTRRVASASTATALQSSSANGQNLVGKGSNVTGPKVALPGLGEVVAAVTLPLLLLRRAASPRARALRQGRAELAAMQKRATALAQQAKAAKTEYSDSLRELDRISMAVHEERHELRSRRAEAVKALSAGPRRTVSMASAASRPDVAHRLTCGPYAQLEPASVFGDSPFD